MEQITQIKHYKLYYLYIKNKIILGFFISKLKMKKEIPELFKTLENNEIKFYGIFMKNKNLFFERKKIDFEEAINIKDKSIIHLLENEKRNSYVVRGSNESTYFYLDKTIDKLYEKNNFEPFFIDILLNGNGWNYITTCLWFQKAATLLNEEPKITFFRNKWNIFHFSSDTERIMFLQLHRCIPIKWKQYFKSSKQAYQKALEFKKTGKKNKFGYSLISKDGHSCSSLCEAKIDDFLFDNNMKHVKEPVYPGNTKWRADFLYKTYYIEYFGLKGIKEYNQKTKNKIQYARINKIKLIEIYPEDIKNNTFKKKLLQLKITSDDLH